MNNNTTELKEYDKILKYVQAKEKYTVNEKRLIADKLWNESRIDFLKENNYIKITNPPSTYYLTQEGTNFILRGGFVGDYKREKIERITNLLYKIFNPFIAFLSLIISTLALYFSLQKNSIQEEQKLNFSSEINLLFPNLKDTTLKQCEQLSPNDINADSIDLMNQTKVHK